MISNELDPALRGAFERGRAAWPDVTLGYAAFARRIESLAAPANDLTARAEDLYLACACAEGDPQALRRFDAELMSQVPRYVSRFRLPPHLVDEVCQRVRVKQFLGASPAIARYGGRGPLGAWLRIAAVRVAHDVAAEAGQGETTGDLEVLDLLISADDGPDAALAKNLYRERLVAALEEGMRALAPRERTLLRLHFVDGLNIDAIARIYRVHRATAARWLVAIRGQIFERTRELLALRLGASTAEVRSVARLLRDEIHLSATRLLAGG